MKRARSILTTGVGSLAAATALASLTAAPAHAASDVARDAPNDVVTVVRDTENPDNPSTNKSAEIRTATVKHGNRVVFNITVTELAARDTVVAAAGIRSSDGPEFELRASTGFMDNQLLLLRDGEETDCGTRNLGKEFDANKNVITLSVARSCLDNPSTIKWGAVVAAFKRNGNVVADDARRNGNASEDIKLGSNVRFN